jgi:CRP-like cAMP-binding protein
MTNQSFWYLENIDLFGLLCPNKLGESDVMTHQSKTYKKGTNIYLPEDDSDKLFLINEGRIKIGVFGAGGKEIIKAIIGKGEVFGELAIVGETKRRDFALAMEDTSVCIITLNEVKELMVENSNLQLFLMKTIGNRILKVEKRLESLVFKDSRSRIVEYLLELAQTRGQRVGYEMLVRKFNTHQEIANLTATSRQTVTTILNELRSRNLITFDRKRLLIRDLELLEKEALVTT